MALVIDAQPIGAPARFHEVGQFSVGRVPLDDAVVGLIGEVNVAVLIGGGPFGEEVIGGDLFRFSARRNQGSLCHANTTSENQ